MDKEHKFSSWDFFSPLGDLEQVQKNTSTAGH